MPYTQRLCAVGHLYSFDVDDDPIDRGRPLPCGHPLAWSHLVAWPVAPVRLAIAEIRYVVPHVCRDCRDPLDQPGSDLCGGCQVDRAEADAEAVIGEDLARIFGEALDD